MKVQLLSTNRGMKSASLKRLAQELSQRFGYKVFRTVNIHPGRIQFRYGHQVNKLDQYQWFQNKGLSALDYTVDQAQAQAWVNEGLTVFGRETLTGSEGKGIKVFEQGLITPCPVYTKYKKKKREFRVHIFKNKVVAIVEKRKKQDWDGPNNSMIRNTAHGYVFCQEVALPPQLKQRIEETSLKARKVTKSDFAGVDIAYNERHDDLFIIEVNSAPGIEGSNVQHYCNAIQQVLQ